MSDLKQSEALDPKAPERTGAGTTGASKQVATAASTSTTEQDTTITTVEGKLVTFSFGANSYICFGTTGMGAAAATDFYVVAGAIVTWRIYPSTRYFRVYGTGTSVVSWYVSS